MPKVKNMKLGIIGGSGLYNIGNIDKEEWIKVDTPWGSPSDDLLKCTIENKEIIFLPRHGRGHKINPSNINYRAAIKDLCGCPAKTQYQFFQIWYLLSNGRSSVFNLC